MTYNKKLALLSSITAALALVYILSVIFEPERAGARSAAYTWLDPKLVDRIDRIRISDPAPDAADPVELVRKNNQWFVAHNGRDYPAKPLRVEDFIGGLTKRASYPLRSSAASSHERLGLAENAAFRIVVSGGAGLPLLDLLVGQADQTGREVYLRRQGENEVRSGEDIFTAYASAARSSWYDLRLFTDNPGLDDVQRLTVHDEPGAPPEGRVFTRSDREWTFAGMNIANPDMTKVDTYIRSILNAEGEDFSDTLGPEDPALQYSRITLELGNGSVRTIRLAAPDQDGRRLAAISSSPFVFSLSGWAAGRLFRDAAFFERDQE